MVDEIADRRPGSGRLVLADIDSKWDLRGILAHAHAIRRLRPDVIHVQLVTPWRAQGGILAGILDRRAAVVAVENCPLPADHRRQRVSKRAASRRLDAHLACGEWLAREIEALTGCPPNSIETIRYGIPDVPLDPPPRPFPGFTVGTVARLVPEKGVDVLLRAVCAVPEASCVVVGDGPSRRELADLAGELGITERVHFTGFVEDARSWLAAMDVFVLASLMEGLPLTPVEAMLAGVPVVASDVGGVAEAVVDGKSGLLVPPADAPALAAAIRRILEEPGLDDALREGGRRRAEEAFSVPAMARAYEGLYRRVRRRS